jgi:aspartokinase
MSSKTHSQTSFETSRGISDITVSPGWSLVVVRGVDVAGNLEKALELLENGGFSIDFVKMGAGQFSFIIAEERQHEVVDVLSAQGFEASHHRSKAIIRVSSPNVRDESGLMARIAQIVIQSGATIYNVGDMHDCVMVVVQTEKSEKTAAALREFVGRTDIL